ncbi:hypothetical protein L3Q82_024258, partial [Scortum barcoo]
GDSWMKTCLAAGLMLITGVDFVLYSCLIKPMSDCEETDFLWGSWTSPGKRKRKKGSKKDEKGPQCKNKKTITIDENIQKKKKKKNSKFKEAMAERKEQKKEKKNNKNKLALEVDHTLLLMTVSSTPAKPAVKPEMSSPRSNEELKPDDLPQDSKKRNKRTKRVAFDLSSGYICAKHPEVASSSPLHPRESAPSENEAVRDSESWSQVTVTDLSLGHTHDNDSQCPSEDINSQDLFITQKTFRASPSQPFSGEASNTVVTASPEVFTQGDRHLHTSEVQIKQHLEDSHVHQRHRKTKKHVKKPKTVQILIKEKEEEEQGYKSHQSPRMGKFHTQMDLNASLVEEKKACPVHRKPRVVSPYLAEPVVVRSSLDVTKSKKHSSTTSTSTQTENFFTTELSSYLDFCQKTSVTAHFEDLKPLDLSLLRRAPLSAMTSLSLPGGVQDDVPEDLSIHPSRSSDVKDVEVQREASGWTQSKGGATLNSQSESELRSEDTTASSEDNEPLCRTSKLDLTQVRAVQMRLNESFFFKTKGERQPPRPASPLMKLAQSREVKSSKGH